MSFWKKFKNKEDLLSREQGEYFFKAGEEIVSRLKIDEKIRKANKYGNEKPQNGFFVDISIYSIDVSYWRFIYWW